MPEKDARQPIHLSADGATGATILRAISDAIRQTLEGQGVALILSGYVEGAGLKGGWTINVRDMQLGQVFLVPQPDAEAEA